jgi:hypothetical protein
MRMLFPVIRSCSLNIYIPDHLLDTSRYARAIHRDYYAVEVEKCVRHWSRGGKRIGIVRGRGGECTVGRWLEVGERTGFDYVNVPNKGYAAATP